jgi:hypothetical protein
MTRSLIAGLVLAGCALTTLPPSAEAQLGGLIKKKVTDAIKKKPADSAQAPGKQPSGSQNNPAANFGSAVLEITQANFDAVIRGLNAELKLQDEFRQVLAKFPTDEQYAACKAHVPESPEGKKLMAEYANAMQDPKPAEMQRRMLAVGEKLEALEKTQCPNDPYTWNSSKRMEKLEQIREQAAEAAGIGASTSSVANDDRMSIREQLQATRSIFRGWRVAFANGQQYGILVERIERGCRVLVPGFSARVAPVPNIPPLPGMNPGKDVKPGKDATPGDLDNPSAKPEGGGPGQALKVPGVGQNIYWVFTPDEVKLLNPANCNPFADLVKRLMK